MAGKVSGRKINFIKEELQYKADSRDPKDPLYDSADESEADIYFETYRPTNSNKTDDQRPELQRSDSSYVRHRPVTQKTETLPYPEFIRIVTERILPDGFISEDSGEVCEALKELNCPQYADGFIAKAVSSSFDHSIEKQKWISELVTILFDSKIVLRAAASRGFEKLIQKADDIKLDVPDAHEKILKFVRCAIDDGVLDQSFILRLPEGFLRNLIPGNEVPAERALSGHDLEELQQHLQTLKTFKSAVEKFIVEDFMLSGSQEDLEHQLINLGHPEFKHEVVRRLVKVSMGLTDGARELVSTTLSDRFGTGDARFSLDDIVVGFVRILGEIEDIMIDVPNAPTLLAKFMICAVVDEILPPIVILDCMRLGIGGEEGRNVTKTVKMWVLQERKGVVHVERFRKIWKSAHPDQPESKEFKQRIRDMVVQHFDDGDMETTRQQLDELEMAPDQAIVFVRKVLELAIERQERERKVGLELLQSLLQKGDLHPQTVRQGFEQAWKCLPDLVIDVPGARDVLLQLTAAAKSTQMLAADFPDSQ